MKHPVAAFRNNTFSDEKPVQEGLYGIILCNKMYKGAISRLQRYKIMKHKVAIPLKKILIPLNMNNV